MMRFNFIEHNPNTDLTPLILLHGWGGSIRSLSALATELSNQIPNPIINLELPGFGITPPDKEIMGTIDYAEFVYNFLKYKKIKNCILCGHSFGGKTSIAFALKYPAHVKGMVLINSSGVKPQNTLKRKIFKTLAVLAPNRFRQNQLVRKIFYNKLVRENDYLNAGKLKHTFQKVVVEHFDNKLQNIKTPTLIIWSEKDKSVPLFMATTLHKKISNSKLIVVPEETHGFPLHNPVKVAELITNYLKS